MDARSAVDSRHQVPDRLPGLAALRTVNDFVRSVRPWVAESGSSEEDLTVRVGALMTTEAREAFAGSIAPITATLSPRLPFELTCALADIDEPPAFRGWIDCTGAFATATLPLEWLTNIAVPRLAAADGEFVLADTGVTRAQVRWEREDDELWTATVVQVAV